MTKSFSRTFEEDETARITYRILRSHYADKLCKYSNVECFILFVTGVTAYCLHPGLIDSGIWRNVPFPLNIPLWLIVKTCFKVCTSRILIVFIFVHRIFEQGRTRTMRRIAPFTNTNIRIIVQYSIYICVLNQSR